MIARALKSNKTMVIIVVVTT